MRKYIKLRRLLVVVFVFLCTNIWAVAPNPLMKMDSARHVKLHFRVNRSLLERDYMSNFLALRKLDTLLRHSSFIKNADTLIVSSGASAEGGSAHNKYLARKRAEAIKSYILWQHSEVNQNTILINPRASTWDDMIPLVKADTLAPYQADILRILSYRNSFAVTERQLRQFAQGKAWNYIKVHYLPYFRSGIMYITLDVNLDSRQIQPPKPSVVVDSLQQDNIPIIISTPVSIEEPLAIPIVQPVLPTKTFTPLFALKTDLILWGGVMPNFQMGTWTPNLTLEVYFAKRWSAQFGWSYANWNSYTGDKRLAAVSAFDLEGRYWIKPDGKYKGLFTSVYAQSGDYDKQKDQAEFRGQTGTFWGLGVGAGYMLPLSNHWGFEAQVRVGYRSAANEFYDIEPGHYYFDYKQNNSTLSAQFRLQVVYRFGKPSKK